MENKKSIVGIAKISDRSKQEPKERERKLDEILKVNDKGLVSARNLHEFLEVGRDFTTWIKGRISKYDFSENNDFTIVWNDTKTGDVVDYNGNSNSMVKLGYECDYAITIDMAKELSMVENNDRGKQARKYFIQVEKAWNSPEMIMKRALEIANKQVENLKLENAEKTKTIEEQKPKVIFADAVSASNTSILVGELSKILRQNGIKIGGQRLFEWLRNNGYLIKRKGTDWNMPTQRSMEQGLFEIKEGTRIDGNGVNITTKTPKVTGKGQQYFINKFLNEEAI